MNWENAPEDLLVTEAAELLRCHTQTVYRRLERGEWPFAWKVGQSWRIDKAKLRDHMKGNSLRQPAEDPMPKRKETRRQKFDALVEAESVGRFT